MRRAIFLVALSTPAFAEAPRSERKPPLLTKADPIPKVAGKVTVLEEKKSAAIGGVQVTFKYASHKHGMAGGPPAPGMWGFDFVKGSKQDVELRHTDTGFESEVNAHGQLLVFRHVDYTKFEIVHAGAAGKPLDDDACGVLIDAAAKKRGFPTDGPASTTQDNGIYVKNAEAWRGFCGSLTKRVWFAPPRLRDKE